MNIVYFPHECLFQYSITPVCTRVCSSCCPNKYHWIGLNCFKLSNSWRQKCYPEIYFMIWPQPRLEFQTENGQRKWQTENKLFILAKWKQELAKETLIFREFFLCIEFSLSGLLLQQLHLPRTQHWAVVDVRAINFKPAQHAFLVLSWSLGGRRVHKTGCWKSICFALCLRFPGLIAWCWMLNSIYFILCGR